MQDAEKETRLLIHTINQNYLHPRKVHIDLLIQCSTSWLEMYLNYKNEENTIIQSGESTESLNDLRAGTNTNNFQYQRVGADDVVRTNVYKE